MFLKVSLQLDEVIERYVMKQMFGNWMPGGAAIRKARMQIFFASLAWLSVVSLSAQGVKPNDSARPPGNTAGPELPPRFDGPPGGPGGNPRGFGGVRAERKVVKQFDQNGDGWLNANERKVAREFLAKGGQEGGGGRERRFPGPRGDNNSKPAQPGPKVAVSDAKSFPDAPLYATNVVRTFFLEFENPDWEKELSDFHGTDVEVPARLTVDGKSYPDVGVHFRGMSSYMMVGEGRKRSLNLSLDLAHKKQELKGYRTLNLLNSHEDPTFLRSVLFYQIAREYIPAPKANFARVVINGESWGVYVNVEQFNKDFVKESFGTTKGARWKVPGSPGAQGSLAYLGDDPAPYKRIYEIKSKDDRKSWTDLIKLCKVLNETQSNRLEQALAPLLDVDGALKFLALDNALINNDGYWIRTSDYSIYEDSTGKFHILPQDANETFSKPGGPGFGGGPGGRGGGNMMVARQMLSQADKNGDEKITKEEFIALADAWFERLDADHTKKLDQAQFTAKFGAILALPRPVAPGEGPGPENPRGPGRGPGGPGPAGFLAPGFFAAADANKDDSLTRTELKERFERWFDEWDSRKTGFLTEEMLRNGLTAALPRPNPAGPGGPGAPGSRAIQVKGVELDPLIAANDASKPLISKLLAVPALRDRYLAYVRDIAEKWLDWNKLGPLAEQYHSLIKAEVIADTRKLDSDDDFAKGLTEEIQGQGGGPGRGGTISLKNFADQRRAYLLEKTGIKRAAR